MWSAPADNGLPRRRSKTTDSDSTQRVPPLSFFLPTARSRGTTHAPTHVPSPRPHAAIAAPARRRPFLRRRPARRHEGLRNRARRPSHDETKAFARENERSRSAIRAQSFLLSSAVAAQFARNPSISTLAPSGRKAAGAMKNQRQKWAQIQDLFLYLHV